MTIIGMIAAFLTASITPILTESVKNNVQHRAKLRNLRVALHKEMWHNYFNLREFSARIDFDDVDNGVQTIDFVTQHALRTECYKDALENELHEAVRTNFLQGTLIGRIFALSAEIKSVSDQEILKRFLDEFLYSCQNFQNRYAQGFYENWDRKILLNMVTDGEYQEIMNRAKKWKKKRHLLLVSL